MLKRFGFLLGGYRYVCFLFLSEVAVSVGERRQDLGFVKALTFSYGRLEGMEKLAGLVAH